MDVLAKVSFIFGKHYLVRNIVCKIAPYYGDAIILEWFNLDIVYTVEEISICGKIQIHAWGCMSTISNFNFCHIGMCQAQFNTATHSKKYSFCLRIYDVLDIDTVCT